MRHPAVGDAAHAPEREVRAAGVGLAVRQPLGVGRKPDRTRVLHRLGLQRQAGEFHELALERLVVLRPEMPQHMHVLDHVLAPVVGLDAHRRRFRLPQRPRAAAGAGDQPGAAIRQHVERGPFVGEHQADRAAQTSPCRRGRAARARCGRRRRRAASSASSRRLTNSASPHQTESISGEASTASASFSRSAGVVRPTSTPRLDRVTPNFMRGLPGPYLPSSTSEIDGT